MLFLIGVVSLVVRIAAFQAVDPGSNPGHRIIFFPSLFLLFRTGPQTPLAQTLSKQIAAYQL